MHHDGTDVLPVINTRDQTRATYDRIAPFYQMIEGVWEGSAVRRGLSALHARAGEFVLEVGCGPGVALVSLARDIRPTGQAVGLDLSREMCRRAHRRIEEADLAANAGIVQGDAAELPFRVDSFDACFMSFTLELFDTPDMGRVLAETRRVLRSGGRVGVVALTKEGPDSMARRLYEWGHVRFRRILDCRPIFPAASLSQAGFEVDQTIRTSIWGLPIDIVVATNPSRLP